MNLEEATDILWDGLQQGTHYPQSLAQKLTLEEGFQVQQAVLARHIANREKQWGWKMALTAPALRTKFGYDARLWGYVLERRIWESGVKLDHGEIPAVAVEAELSFTMGKTLKGPGVTMQQVAESVESVAPAIEVVSIQGNLGGDIPLGVADNIYHYGVVEGEKKPLPAGLDLGDVSAEIWVDDKLIETKLGRDSIDNQLDTLAFLVNQLAKFDLALEAGSRVITGSFIPPTPSEAGKTWKFNFSHFGEVSLTLT